MQDRISAATRAGRGMAGARCIAAAVAALGVCTGTMASGQMAAGTGGDDVGKASATTTVEQEGLRLDVSFSGVTAEGGVRVEYALTNTGDGPVAVLDRGDRHAVLTRRQRLGATGAAEVVEQDGDVTLRHVARALPDPTPTVPPVPLAARVESGATLRGGFDHAPLLSQPPKRLRWCVGTTPFDADRFSGAETGVDGVEVWRASFDVAAQQVLLCTPWFDVSTGRFD